MVVFRHYFRDNWKSLNLSNLNFFQFQTLPLALDEKLSGNSNPMAPRLLTGWAFLQCG